MPAPDPAAAKAALRQQMKALRAGCDPALGVTMATHIWQDCPPPAESVVGGFWPLGSEIDTRPLLRALAGRGYQVALPETPHPGSALTFRQWMAEDELVQGRFGTQHSTGAVLTPDFLLVPLLAFDAGGHRLGYGGGYYDRTLAALPAAFRLGCAFAAQEIPAIPVDAYDLPLHAVATEIGIKRFR